jgi:hypothetical protein
MRYVGKHCTAGEATNDNMAHAQCMWIRKTTHKHTHTHTQNVCCLLLLHCHNGCMNAPHCYKYEYTACLISYVSAPILPYDPFDVFRQNYACVYFSFYVTSPYNFYLIAHTVLGNVLSLLGILIGTLIRLGPGRPRTRWRLSMGKRLSLLSVQPQIQRVPGIRRLG